jgi:hypothetical protein
LFNSFLLPLLFFFSLSLFILLVIPSSLPPFLSFNQVFLIFSSFLPSIGKIFFLTPCTGRIFGTNTS